MIGNLEDGGFGAEYIAKRVADLYIPGAFVAGMKPAPDLTPGQSKFHLQVLRDTSENKPSALTVPNYLSKVNDAFRKQLADNLIRLRSFVFLGSERISPEHFMLDTTAAEVFHYKMVLSDRTVYYHFRIDKSGKITWISVEE